jgi:hypothetical protein
LIFLQAFINIQKPVSSNPDRADILWQWAVAGFAADKGEGRNDVNRKSPSVLFLKKK